MPPPSRRHDLLVALTDLGGVATGADLIRASSRPALRGCVSDGSVIRAGHGVYTLATFADPALGGDAPTRAWSRWTEGPSDQESAALTARHAIARGRAGVLSLRCAAAHYGWPILREPTQIDIALPLGRKARTVDGAVRVWLRELSEQECHDRVTSPLSTVMDCARHLPFDEALAVADSALRSKAVGRRELREAGEVCRGVGAAAVRRVCGLADGRAANPFESALRAVHAGVRGLQLTPQVEIGGDGFESRTDLADERLRIVVEADSYAFHGDRELFEKTQRRQVELAGRDWIVLPYGWSAVTGEAAWVRAATQAVVHVRESRGYGSALRRQRSWAGAARRLPA